MLGTGRPPLGAEASPAAGTHKSRYFAKVLEEELYRRPVRPSLLQPAAGECP